MRLEARQQVAPLQRQLKQAEAEIVTCHGQMRRLEEQLRGSALALKGSASDRNLKSQASLCAGLLSAPSGGGEAGMPVDMVYLKNVLIKFLQAVAASKQQERDALLPVIGTLLGTSPQEFLQLKSAVAAGPVVSSYWAG